jgi:NhaP-type Na+/H+ or K+/H+ antiporter
MRTMALLIALMRGGLNVKMATVWSRGLPVLALAFVPYVLEMAVEAAAAPVLLPGYYGPQAKGAAPTSLVAWLSASVWAPLSPSIVIPNALLMVEATSTRRRSC